MQRLFRIVSLMLVCVILSIVTSGFAENQPKPDDKANYVELPPYNAENVFYGSFDVYPRTLDPARSYSSNEAAIIGTIYEPPLAYHPLKRPYELMPLTAEKMPKFVYKWKESGENLTSEEVKKLLHETKPGYTDEEIAKIDIYLDIKIKKGIYYAPHPCFARDEKGNLKYYNLKDEDVKNFNGDIYNLKVTEKDTRELVAADYVYQMKRILLPSSNNPISDILENNFVGIWDFVSEIYKVYKAKLYEQQRMSPEEKYLKPIHYDLDKIEFKAAEVINKYTYRIHFKKPNTKFLHWMAMPFFSPMPKEADEFFYQKPLRKELFVIKNNPVGTGPYYLRIYNDNKMESWRNPIYRKDFYPSTGEASDKANGYLDDAGKQLPIIDKIIRYKVKDPDQIWDEFLNGRFAYSGVSYENFDKHIKFVNGKPEISQFLKDRNIKLRTSVRTSTGYYAFNMLDENWGGLEERKCLKRQAVAIALNMEEFNEKYYNGRNISSHSIIPPGIFGYDNPEDITYLDNIEDLEYYFYILINESDKKRSKLNELTDKEKEYISDRYSVFFSTYKELDDKHKTIAKKQLNRTPKDEEVLVEVHFGLNWAIYKWDKKLNKPVRRDISYAKTLLKQASYKTDDKEIDLQILSMGVSQFDIDISNFRAKQLKGIGINFDSNKVKYSEFIKHIGQGDYDFVGWGWNADYPDPENLMFLLYGPNHKVDIESGPYKGYGGGENVANYGNPEYDKLFKQMENMENSTKRLKIIRRMINILRHDNPWILYNLGCSYILMHDWYKNAKTNLMGNDSYKYRRIDVESWSKYLEKYAGIEPIVPPKNDDE